MTKVSGDYSSFISKLQSKGLKTTSLGGNETNFKQYGDALSSKLKQEILQSFDKDEDYVLQQKVSQLFKNSNVMDSGSFISACQSLGLKCSVTYESTSYISDYKAGNFSGSVGNGSIAVYTISDGKGGEIKIADANGNGYLESEELFMNEILGDIGADIGAQGADNKDAVKDAEGAENGASQEDFNEKAESYMRKGLAQYEAEKLANILLDTNNLEYTGDYKPVSQDEFNEKVEEHLQNGSNRQLASELARAELDVEDMYYTGNGIQDTSESAEDGDITLSNAMPSVVGSGVDFSLDTDTDLV